MKMKTTAFLAATLSIVPTLAHAHPGHGTGFTSGFVHPIFGWDHLLAMVAVGLWAAQLGGRARWIVPAAFVGAMVIGSLLATAGMPLPLVEPAILASVIILGLLVVAAARLPLAVSIGIASVFALFHGAAHGAEIPANAGGLTYTLGFALATAALHGAGLAFGTLASRSAHVSWPRFAGGAIAVAGALLSFS